MDRRLTENEQDEYRKKYGLQAPALFKVSYRALIRWFVLVAFLAIPSLVEYSIELVGINTNTTESPALKIAETSEEPVVRVYTARTWGPKGIFAVHSWIAMKRQGSEEFEVSQVIGWRQAASGNVLFRETGVPIDSWWGNEATLILDLQGVEAASVINRVDSAINEYPWKNEYRLFPGPNSNTFVAWVGLQAPEMGLDLPSTAIGKDWRPFDHALGASASGTGYQASLFGLLGTSVGFEEGLEVNILGLNFEFDLLDLAVEVPLFGRYGFWYLLSYLAAWPFIRKLIGRTRSKYLLV